MKIIKHARPQLEVAHGGSGGRKVLLKSVTTSQIEAMTDGYLPAGNIFDWHSHDGIDEMMYVLSGSGKVHDRDGEYDYAEGDLFLFPANVEHKITADDSEDSRMIFLRYTQN